MRLPRLLAALVCFGFGIEAAAADFLIAMSNDNPNAPVTTPLIRSIAYDPDNNYAVTGQKNLLTGFTNTLGVATLGDSLYVSNNSRNINGYTLSPDGSGNLDASALAGFTTVNGVSGQFFRGISVNSNAILAPYTGTVTTVARYDPLTGAAASPASFTGDTNKWKAAQSANSYIYVVSTTAINVYDSSGTFFAALNVTGTSMRDIVFQDATTFYVSDFSGGTIRKYLLTATATATLDTTWATSGTFSAGSVWGLALSSDKSQLFYSRYFSSDLNNHSFIGRLSTTTGGSNTVIASAGNLYGYQYLTVVTVVPEPASLLLGMLGAAALVMSRFSRRVRKASHHHAASGR